MPSLTHYELFDLAKRLGIDLHTFRTFVETGTYLGDTTQDMLPFFTSLHTIELSEKFYQLALTRFASEKSVQCHQGDSTDILPLLCPLLDSNTVFWLDGHFSAGPTAQGAKDCPLVEELQAISQHLSSDALIIIDDARLFGWKGDQDWSAITEESLLAVLDPQRIVQSFYIPSALHPRDRFVIYYTSASTANAE